MLPPRDPPAEHKCDLLLRQHVAQWRLPTVTLLEAGRFYTHVGECQRAHPSCRATDVQYLA